MPSTLIPEASFLWNSLWQTTVCLMVGLAGSFLWAWRPARAHRVLLLAMVACLVTPVLSLTVRQLGWGVFVRQAPMIQSDVTANPPIPAVTPVAKGENSAVFTSSPEPTLPLATGASLEITNLGSSQSLSWGSVLMWAWVALSAVALVRFLRSLIQGLRLVAQARPLADARIQQAVDGAVRELGLKAAPETYVSDDVCGPLVWCWWRPALLLPSSVVGAFVPKEWHGVLCHELAHLKRRDHLAVLLGEVLVCTFPWQPLAWWARWRMGNLSEQVCDDWVLAGGRSPTTYAQLVLSLLPERQPALVLGAMPSRASVKGRIRHILRGKRSDPRSGRRWACAATVAALCIATTMAFAQTRAVTLIVLPSVRAEDTRTGENPTLTLAETEGESESGGEESTPAMTLRLVRKERGFDFTSPPSPDGKYETDIDWTTGDLMLRELTTGKTRRLTNKGSWEAGKLSDLALYSRISPDTTKAAYSWLIAEDETYELRVIEFDGSGERVLYEDAMWIQPFGWSPDSKQVLAAVGTGSGSQIVLTSVVDGSVQVLKALADLWPENACFSPDGRYVAYDIQKREASSDYDIFLIAANSSEEKPLIASPAKERLLGWSPDGKWILYAGDRLGSMDAYLIQFRDGEIQGDPQLIKKDIGDAVYPKGFTRNGSFYYSIKYSSKSAYIAKMDFETSELLSPPTPISKGSTGYTAWSPNGKYLAYINFNTVPFTLCLWTVDTDLIRQIPLPRAGFRYDLCWLPNGESILCYQPGEGLRSINIQTGAIATIMEESMSDYKIGRTQCLPNAKSILYHRSEPTMKRLVMRDIESGEEKEIVSDPNLTWDYALSPDGSWLVFSLKNTETKSGTLKLLAMSEGEEPREIVRLPEGFVGFTWCPDSNITLCSGGLALEGVY